MTIHSLYILADGGVGWVTEWDWELTAGTNTTQQVIKSLSYLLIDWVSQWVRARGLRSTWRPAENICNFSALKRFRLRAPLLLHTFSHRCCSHLEQTSTNAAPTFCWEDCLHLSCRSGSIIPIYCHSVHRASRNSPIMLTTGAKGCAITGIGTPLEIDPFLVSYNKDGGADKMDNWKQWRSRREQWEKQD